MDAGQWRNTCLAHGHTHWNCAGTPVPRPGKGCQLKGTLARLWPHQKPWWIAGGILLAFGITGLSARWLIRETRVKSVPVAVAFATLAQGTRITPGNIAILEWPNHLLPPGFISDLSHLEGRYVRATVPQGMPILESVLVPEGARGGLSAIITQGRRAMTVRVNEVVGVAGFALPGNYVDVVVNSLHDGAPGRTATSISKIVLEHVPVLAVAQEANPDETKPHVVNAVTLEVTPIEAEQLDLARSIGTLSLVLRNQVDQQITQTTGATRQTLLDGFNSRQARSQEPATELIRGIERSVLR
ncbi:MAG: Flp pilus assembly protein CpaB [Betaproteobacteria bacterium]|nr:Flp pilus assembly protein CpaB [Betaproteobacteria bacterium]